MFRKIILALAVSVALVIKFVPPPLSHAETPSFRYGLFDDGNLYSAARMQQVIAALKQHGFDSLMLTNGNAQQEAGLLSIADGSGIKVTLGPAEELNAQWWPANVSANLSLAQQIINPLADQLKNHTSLDAYYLIDEPDADQAEKVRLGLTAFQQRDPSRAALPILIGTDRSGTVYDAAKPKAMVLDVYPIGTDNQPCNLTMSGFGYNMDMVDYIRQIKTGRTAPLWLILQTHGLDALGLRTPSPAEVRLQHFIGLGEDAKAIYWFIYTSQQGWTGLEDSPLMTEVDQLGQRLTNVRGPLANAHKVSDLFGAGANYSATLQSNDGLHTYVVAANRQCSPSTLHLSGPAGQLRDLESGTLMSSSGDLPLEGGDGRVFEFLSGSTAPNAGVPSLNPDFSQSVEQWWANHPYNPDGLAYNPVITSPAPLVNVATQYAGNLQAAYNALPATGGTLYLPAGTYELGSVVWHKSNVHILGDGPTSIIHGLIRWDCGPEADVYADFNLAVDQQQSSGGSAWTCITSGMLHNIYFHNLTFSGLGYNGTTDQNWFALAFSAARDILVDGVTFRDYPMHPSFHMGLINGNSRLTNIFFLNSHFVGPERWASYLDGCHGCGVVGSTVEGSNFGSGNFLFLTNDDFTYDYNRNGQFDLDEQRSANYIALYRNTQTGYTYQGSSISGGHALVAQNQYNSTYNLGVWSARCSQKWASTTNLVYHHSDIRVRDNTVNSIVSDGALGLGRFEMGNHNQNCFDTAHFGTLGDYSVTNNVVVSGPASFPFATEVDTVDGPKLVSGNCVNCAVKKPTPTRTPAPTATSVPPTPTKTPSPLTPTSSPTPSPTATKVPSTATPVPTATTTPEPSCAVVVVINGQITSVPRPAEFCQ